MPDTQGSIVMLYITRDGHVDAERIKVKIFSSIERGKLDVINGIVVHQTGGSTADGAFSSYQKAGANGAHFLIDKDGTIYQTASLFRVTNHVGHLKSRCMETRKCTAAELKAANSIRGPINLSRFELRKNFPSRFPSNTDSLGIEIVGRPIEGKGEDAIYEPVNAQQNASLQWLVKQLGETLGVSMREVYKHPQVSYKVKTEAATAIWQRDY
ncbi:peptidoglycan recognition family protein [Variovorax ureilyticus]|uniref:N-acetylmuramoyl-L-alanine amidase n=1 Tax=Variovorax ureilyticus TaxID=1836198 RepID=A0ABU8VEZ5_9BURK